jgi:predicted nicotinamide N-methyase
LVPEILLHVASDFVGLWEKIAALTGDPDAPLPFWATAWPGGQAVARYVLDRPVEVAGHRLLDLASGSGLCAIAANLAAADDVTAVDVDLVAGQAILLNAAANNVHVRVREEDILFRELPEVDVILAGDVCYEREMAPRVLDWLRRAHERGTRVLIGDPMRAYFPVGDLVRLASYEVPISLDLEDRRSKLTGVYTFGSDFGSVVGRVLDEGPAPILESARPPRPRIDRS